MHLDFPVYDMENTNSIRLDMVGDENTIHEETQAMFYITIYSINDNSIPTDSPQSPNHKQSCQISRMTGEWEDGRWGK